MRPEDTYEQLVPDGLTELDLTLEVQEDPVGEGPIYAHNCGGCGGCGGCRCGGCRCGGCRCGGCRCGGCGGCGRCAHSKPEADTQLTGFALLVAPAKS